MEGIGEFGTPYYAIFRVFPPCYSTGSPGVWVVGTETSPEAPPGCVRPLVRAQPGATSAAIEFQYNPIGRPQFALMARGATRVMGRAGPQIATWPGEASLRWLVRKTAALLTLCGHRLGGWGVPPVSGAPVGLENQRSDGRKTPTGVRGVALVARRNCRFSCSKAGFLSYSNISGVFGSRSDAG